MFDLSSLYARKYSLQTMKLFKNFRNIFFNEFKNPISVFKRLLQLIPKAGTRNSCQTQVWSFGKNLFLLLFDIDISPSNFRKFVLDLSLDFHIFTFDFHNFGKSTSRFTDQFSYCLKLSRRIEIRKTI